MKNDGFNGYGDYINNITRINMLLKLLDDKELIEILANIEHTRWANWQKYLHSLCIKNEDGSLTIPKERVDWWNKEIETSYYDLEEHIKQYDRDEVMNTLNAINEYLKKN